MPNEGVTVYEHVVLHAELDVSVRDGPFIDILKRMHFFWFQAVLWRDGCEVLDGGGYAFDVCADDVISVECSTEVEILAGVLLEAWLFGCSTFLTVALAELLRSAAPSKKNRVFFISLLGY